MKMTQAIQGFLFSLRADGYSQSTIELYSYVLTMLTGFLENPDVQTIQAGDLTRYFVYLRTEYTPNRMNGSIAPLSGSSLQNHWKGIRTFFRWATDELSLKQRPDAKLKLPPNNPKVVRPLEEEEVKALLEAAEFTRTAATNGRKPFKMHRKTAFRDSALILVLLDTGVRAGEAGRLNIGDVDLEAGEILITPYGSSQRKTKSRVLPIGRATRKALWRYLTNRPDTDKDDPLFLSENGRRLEHDAIRHLLVGLGEKAGVKNCHPHRLRHTFAIEFLRNGGDVFTLQMLLGHSSLKMVQTYAKLAKIDAKNIHRKASPADKWRL
jgi:integrase/recombinase XerD